MTEKVRFTGKPMSSISHWYSAGENTGRHVPIVVSGNAFRRKVAANGGTNTRVAGAGAHADPNTFRVARQVVVPGTGPTPYGLLSVSTYLFWSREHHVLAASALFAAMVEMSVVME